jgi:hypothetical protein
VLVCDRFPLRQVKLIDSPYIGQVLDRENAGFISRTLMRLEESFYKPMRPPDVLLVLGLAQTSRSKGRRMKTQPRFASGRQRSGE